MQYLKGTLIRTTCFLACFVVVLFGYRFFLQIDREAEDFLYLSEIVVDGKPGVFDPNLLIYETNDEGVVLSLFEMVRDTSKVSNETFKEIVVEIAGKDNILTGTQILKAPMPLGERSYEIFAFWGGTVTELYLYFQKYSLAVLSITCLFSVLVLLACPLGRRLLRPLLNRQGMSVTELMVSLCIVGILAAVAIPGYITYVQQARVVKLVLPRLHLLEANICFFYSTKAVLPSNLDLGEVLENVDTDSLDIVIANGTIRLTINAPASTSKLHILDGDILLASPVVERDKITAWHLDGELADRLKIDY